ncbi:MAG: ABC-F family ATP-binding cassette domain-containing protein [Lachnospiraceae bacterium]|nr:ABC-F family ATP-binding cassette domain-containing protein [Lachnospiraceae bacterium]
MNILSVENVTKAYGERKLFDEASFYLQDGEKVGIIGINGTGKSTLLKIIAGLEEVDEGTVTMANHLICSYLPQHPSFFEEETVLEALLRIARAGSKSVEDTGVLETRGKAMLTKLQVTDFEEKCGILSGGQRKRLALVASLLTDADLLVLDEPTNHLDADMADWLEEQLKQRRGAVVMITHDRYFLDSVVNRIIEIDKGKIYSYQANYEGFLERKAAREEDQRASERKRQSILRKELEWVRRGARARTTKQKARLERYEELKNAQGPVSDGQVVLGSVSERLGNRTVEIANISKAYGEKKLIENFSYLFLKGDRVGFVGKNGSGKTTLLKMIIGEEAPDAGEIFIGQTVKIGYYSQEINEEEMPPNQKVIDYIKDQAEYIQTSEGSISASMMLERFLFEGKDQYGLLKTLSGGERRRLYLLKVLMKAPNVLILDEPTNDLDISTLTVLEDYLDQFQGIVITVSHDRYFLDRIVNRIFAFEEDGQICQYEGNYTDYHAKVSAKNELGQEAAKKEKKEKSETDKSWKKHETKLKFSYKEQRDYETIESEIASLEEKIEQLEAQILTVSTDFVKLSKLMEEKSQAESLLEEKMDRWMYLEDLKAQIDAQ